MLCAAMASPTFAGTSTLVASSRQVSTNVEGESVILNFDEGVYYGLDEVGARVWELLQSPVTFAAIRERLLAEYEVEPDRCERDLRSLLGELAEAGLVEVGDGDSG
jgi:hypothetical protein